MSQKQYQNKKEKKEKEIPEYMKLYPEFEPINEIKDSTSKNNQNTESNNEEDEEKYEINETFLEIVLKKPLTYGRIKIANTLSKKIQSTELSKKLLSDYRSEKKISEVNICNLFAQSLNYSKLDANQILYRIGENDNRLFYILSGRIQTLKIKELPYVTMTNLDYLNYCKFLYRNNEIYILNEVINNNNKILPFISEHDVALVSKINFLSELLEKLKKHMITKNSELIQFFHLYDYKYDDFNIISSEINKIEQKINKRIQGAQQEWEDYIIDKCSPTESELRFYEPFSNLLKSRHKKFITCFAYENNSYLEQGNYFGEISYDSHLVENKLTIRAQKDTVLAWIKNNDYLNVIDPKRKMEALKEMSFLHNYFFFKEISNNTFEKYYYDHFSIYELNRGNVLFTSGDRPKNLMFLKEGKLSLEIKCTIIDLFFLIKDIFNNLISNPIFNELPNAKKRAFLPKETMNILKRCAYDDRLKRLLRQNPHFFEELKKTRNYQITELNGYDIIGIEEIFLNTPYIMKCTVNDKKVICYGYPLKNISRIIKEGHELFFSFTQTAINKIIFLIKRLDNIKNNSLNVAKKKFDYDLKINENEVNEDKSNNESNIINNLPKLKNSNLLYESYTNNKLNVKTEASESNNNTNNIISFDSSEIHLNANNSFCRTKSPVKKTILSNNIKQVINLHKKVNKTNNISHSSTKNYSLTDAIIGINRQSLFRTNNNIKKNRNSFLSNKKEENDNKSDNDSNKEKNSILFYDKNKKKENILFLGKNRIDIDNIRKDIDEFLSCDNSKKYVEIIQSNKINNKNCYNNFYNHNIPKQKHANLFYKKNFHLSLVPMNNLNIFTDNNKNLEENNYTNTFYGKNPNDVKSITDFIDISSTDNYIPTQKNESNNLLPKINLKIGFLKKKSFSTGKEKMFNLYNTNQNSNNQENHMKKIIKREDVKDIIKDYYKDIKKNGCLSFIPNKGVNTFFMRKFNKKYKDAIKNKKIINN